MTTTLLPHVLSYVLLPHLAIPCFVLFTGDTLRYALSPPGARTARCDVAAANVTSRDGLLVNRHEGLVGVVVVVCLAGVV